MLTIHLVANAHLDPVWMWDWREGMNEGIATCEAVVDLMESDSQLTFARNEAFIYEHIERHRPVLFERIRSLVREGRWEIVGGTMLQPDTNLGCGEAYVRQYLYGQQYFHSRFGFVPEVAYQVDSFGHAAGLPSIYRGAGCRYAVGCRPSQEEFPTGSRLFRWRGPDGSEILTANLDTYCVEFFGFCPEYEFPQRVRQAAEQAPPGLDHWLLLFGLGDHGGGLNRGLVDQVHEQLEHPPDGCILKLSTLREFFLAIQDKAHLAPVVDGELNFCHRGCYTSVGPIKRASREAENLADCAERWATVSGILGQHEYPAQELKDVWKDVLFNHFHDIVTGTSIERACDDALDQLGRARHESRVLANNSALSVFLNVDTACRDGVPVLLFNPHGADFHGPVEVEWMLEYRPTSMSAKDPIVKHAIAVAGDGSMVPTQFLTPESDLPCEWRYRSCLIADVPALGYATYWLQRSEESPPIAAAAQAAKVDGTIALSNGLVRVEHRRGENGIRVTDLTTGEEWFDAPAAAGIVLEDTGDSWGSGRRSWENVLGRFEFADSQVVCVGPLKAGLLLISRYKGSEIVQEFSIHQGSKHIHCEARLLWNEPRRMLKLEFPLNTSELEGMYDTPYATVTRPATAGEVPANRWAAVVGKGPGLGVANAGLHGFDITARSLRMSVVRSPVHTTLDIWPREPERDHIRPFIDIGLHRFRYALTPPEEVADAAELLNMPVQATLGYPHSGTLPAAQSVISVSPREARLVAGKQAEDGDGWIVRLWESSGHAQEAQVLVQGRFVARVELRPWQLHTVRLRTAGNAWSCEDVTLTEGSVSPAR